MSAKIYNSDAFSGHNETNSMSKVPTPFPQTLDDWENILSDIDISLREMIPENYEEHLKLSEQNNISQFWKEMKTSSPYEGLIIEALETLKPQEKAVILKLYWEQKSMRQLAKEMNVSRATIARARDRAQKKIKKYLLSTPPTSSKSVTNLF